jgi:hypothetical protein
VDSCPNCERLLRTYGQAARRFEQAGDRLLRFLSGDLAMFELLWNTCEDARKECADRREELALHLANHTAAVVSPLALKDR